jgi:hypothetical protein
LPQTRVSLSTEFTLYKPKSTGQWTVSSQFSVEISVITVVARLEQISRPIQSIQQLGEFSKQSEGYAYANVKVAACLKELPEQRSVLNINEMQKESL